MVEIFNLFKTIMLIPIPVPFNFSGTILHYNLFGLTIFSFCIFCISFIIHRLFNGDGGVGN
nr:MAG TPA: hypothetical protein [Inoviridae sp.]